MDLLNSTSNNIVIRSGIEHAYDMILELASKGPRRWTPIIVAFVAPLICDKQLLVTAQQNIEEEHFLTQSTTVSIVNHTTLS